MKPANSKIYSRHFKCLNINIYLCSLFLFLFIFISRGYSQDVVSEKIIDFPDRLIKKLDQKTDNINDLLSRSTDKYVRKIANIETKIRRRLTRKDSLAAKKSVGEISLIQAVANKNSSSIPYLPHLDTLRTLLQFLDQHDQKTAGNLKFANSLNQMNALLYKFQEAEKITNIIDERSRVLEAQLSKFGMLKELRKFRKQAYYYKAQLEEYKRVFDDPSRLESEITLMQNRYQPKQAQASPVNFSSLFPLLDNPIKNIDPMGDSTIPGGGFWRNALGGLKDGGTDTWEFIKSVGTTKGWAGVLKGAAVFTATSYDLETLIARAQLENAVVEGIKSIATMNRDDAGHAIGYGTEKVVETVLLSKGAGAASNALKGAGAATLLGAVSLAELSDAGANGVRNTATGYQTGKLFATTASDAAQFGKSNFAFDGITNTIMKVKVPNSVMKTAYIGEMDGMKGVAIPTNQLSKVSFIKPLSYSPKPTNPFNMSGW